MTKIRLISLIAALAVLITLFTVSFSSCSGNDGDEETTKTVTAVNPMKLGETDLSPYITLGAYKGLTVAAGASTKSEALWEAVVSNAEIKSYPEQQVNYYFGQSREKYLYYAQMSYKGYAYVLDYYDMTEEKMLEEAKKLVREDLVFYAIVRAEGISLTDADKSVNYERYVEKFVGSYGYTKDYVRNNMTEYIYQTMLYDKTTEALMLWNTVT